MNQEIFPTAYSGEFEAVWKAFGPSKNDAKSVAYTSWIKTDKRRRSVGAFGQRMQLCVEAYVVWLDAENDRRRKNRQGDHPKVHFATWLNQHRYESYLEEAAARLQAMEAEAISSNPLFLGWETQAERLVAELKRPVVEAWFKGVVFQLGEPPILEFPKLMQAKWVAEHFPSAVLRAFGPCILTVTGRSKERFEIRI